MDALSKQDRITGAAHILFVEDILAVAKLKHIGIATSAAIQRIVTFAADQNVVAATAIERVVPGHAIQYVGLFVAIEDIVAIRSRG